MPQLRIESKPKWTRHRTYQRIRNEIQALEATADTRRFRKPLSTQLFAYHVS
jgi:predicted nucleic acid-binding Zn ribbon protein